MAADNTTDADLAGLLASVRLRVEGRPAAALLLAYPNADMTLSEPSVRQEGHRWGWKPMMCAGP